MKKIVFLAVLTTGLLTFSPSIAQDKKSVTVKTATKSMGYTVINPAEQPVTIYKYVHKAHSPKETEKYAPKYFFVTKSSDVLQELTKENLKKAFPENHAFHDALDAGFTTDSALPDYDSFHKMYKVNHLLSLVK